MSFPKWDGNLNKLFERLQESYGSSVEEYNHIVSSLFQNISVIAVEWQNGVPYLRDPLRGTLLSIPRVTQEFGYYGPNQSSRYLKLGSVVGSGNGFLCMRDACITGLSTRCRNGANYQVKIRKNDETTPLWTVNANAEWELPIRCL